MCTNHRLTKIVFPSSSSPLFRPLVAAVGLLAALGVVSPAGAQDCRNPALPVPDLMTVIDDLVVAHPGIICDLNVSVQINHTWIGDLEIRLEHVDTGTVAVLYDNECGNFDNLDITLDDAAGLPVGSNCATPYTGTYMPVSPLSAFNGEAAAGTWRLSVADQAGADVGTLNEWCLDFLLDTDADGVCDDVDNCVNDANAGQEDGDGDGIGDACDVCAGDNATGDTDADGVCNDMDVCEGNDASGDSDGDGVCDDIDVCDGDDASGDSDGDAVCDDIDACNGDDATGDSDGDGVCDDADPCPSDAADDSDGDGVCDSDDICAGGDDTVDTDADGTPDDCDDTPAGQTACCGGGLPVLLPFMLLSWGWMRRRRTA